MPRSNFSTALEAAKEDLGWMLEFDQLIGNKHDQFECSLAL